MTTDRLSLEARLKAQAFGLGFDLAGITSLGPVSTAAAFDDWMAKGFAGEMTWLARHAGVRADTTRAEPGMRSAIVVGLDYGGRQPAGPFARYARGTDYHRVMWDRLDALGAWLTAECGARTRSYVDTGPILERDLARQAGLGWVGKNTMLINPERGSFFFIGALFTDSALQADAPFDADRCGSCTRCLDACPTQAFPEPHVLDARTCISYLTIELRTDIDETLRAAVGDHIYGCDVCQDVCPWNERFARDVNPADFLPDPARESPDLAEMLALDDAGFRARFRDSAVTRAKRAGFARNVAVALGNRQHDADIPALARAAHDTNAMVRRHARWALEQFGTHPDARAALAGAPLVIDDAPPTAADATP